MGGGQKWPKKTVLGSLKEIAYFYIVFLFFWKTKKVTQFFMLFGRQNKFICNFMTLCHKNKLCNWILKWSSLLTLFLITIGPNKFLSVTPMGPVQIFVYLYVLFFFNTLNRRHWSKFHIWFRLSIEYWSHLGALWLHPCSLTDLFDMKKTFFVLKEQFCTKRYKINTTRVRKHKWKSKV